VSQLAARDELGDPGYLVEVGWWVNTFLLEVAGEYALRMRDGVPVYSFIDQPPLNRKPQRPAPNAKVQDQMREKLETVRNRNYIGPIPVASLTNFFHVDKGFWDIRLVYGGTALGLNASIWVSGFEMPTINFHLRAVGPDTFMADIDIGEIFLNFFLHADVGPYAGVNFTHYFPTEEGKVLWEQWYQCAMGLTSLLYLACQGMGFAEDVIWGDRHDPTNVYRWKVVKSNLPGQKYYDPSVPWVGKMRDSEGKELAANFFIFVDDVRPCRLTKSEAWQAAPQGGQYD
jgi:hypothetical protein